MTDANTAPAGKLRLNDDEARPSSARFFEPEALQTGMRGHEYGSEGMVRQSKAARTVVLAGIAVAFLALIGFVAVFY